MFGIEHFCFYEHSNKEPLDCKFSTKEIELKAMQDLGKSTLIKQLIDSSKNKAEAFSLKIVLGLAAIAGLVLIVVFYQ